MGRTLSSVGSFAGQAAKVYSHGFGGLVAGLIPASGSASNNMSSYGGAVGVGPGEQSFINQLQAQSNGTAQDPAIQQALSQGTAQAQAMAASQRGINPAMAARLGAQEQAQMQQGAAALGVQNQRQTQGMLGNEYQSIRGGQIQQQGNATSGNNAAMQAQGQVVGGLFQGIGAAMGGAKAHGGMIDGPTPPVPGDSSKNDVVPTMLSPGEAVIPRSIMQSQNPGEMAKEFIDQLKSGKKRGQAPDFAKLVGMHREMGEHIKALCGGGKV